MLKRKRSILFIRPDYHCTFFYRDEFRKLGWVADILVPSDYPEQLLYSQESVIRPPALLGNVLISSKFVNYLVKLFWWFAVFWRYEFHLYHGRPPLFSYFEKKLGLNRLFGSDFLFELWLSKIFRVKLIYLPTGCRDIDTKSDWTKLDQGNVCGNCGASDRCDDQLNMLNFSRLRRYFDSAIESCTPQISLQYTEKFRQWKCIDLNLWHPSLKIPEEHVLVDTGRIRILHSTYLEKSGRSWQGRNIKGSPYVLAAIDKLKEEGYLVEYFHINNTPSNLMRFYQIQADIVVEQLIVGWWGSTGVETMALGKPVVCYLRPSWKAFFLKTFPEYEGLPIVEADTNTIYGALKKLVTDEDYRRQKGRESRLFAEKHFDPEKNTNSLVRILEAI
jgi:hypothetical protein